MKFCLRQPRGAADAEARTPAAAEAAERAEHGGGADAGREAAALTVRFSGTAPSSGIVERRPRAPRESATAQITLL